VYSDQIVLLRLRAFLESTRKGRDGITLYFVLWINIRQVSWLACKDWGRGGEVADCVGGVWRSSE
jgi:hypothetical protein